MEGVDLKAILAIKKTNKDGWKKIINGETKSLQVTKSLLNILYNIIRVGSVPYTDSQKEFFDNRSTTVYRLLSKSTPLATKKRILTRSPDIIANIVASCPTVAGL
jgi:hypothetical protein